MTLIKAFEKLRDKNISMQLVCVGADAWMAEDIHLRVDKSKYRKEIVFTGGVIFEDLKIILANAKVFVLPSIHEGFGIPILEAFASKVPVIASNSGSLPEIVGNAGKLFDPKDSNELFLKIEEIISSQGIRERMIRKGIERLNKFSWDKTTRETIKLFDEILNTY